MKTSDLTKKSTSETSASSASTNGETLDLSAGARLVRRVTGRESTTEKAIRLLATGRLEVTLVNGSLVRGRCRGDNAVYQVDYGMTREGRWTCSCPSRGGCSHLQALQAVVAVGR